MKSDKIILLLSLMILLTSISWISSCTHKTDTKLPDICYKDVNAIIVGRCYLAPPNPQVCHDGNAEGVNLSSDTAVYNAVRTPGNADTSPLYKAIIKVRGENKMPPDQPLSQESRTTIRIWIEQGADIHACVDSKGIIQSSEDTNQ